MNDTVDPTAARYARQRILPGIGAAGQRSLADARVVLLGAGGLGSAVLPVLVASGIGTIVLVDDDIVEVTNLHRQILHGVADVGASKVESAVESAARLSPETRVIAVAERFTAENAERIAAEADLLIDGTDDILTRYVADDLAARLGIALVWGSAARFSGQVGVVWPARGVSYRDLFPYPPADGGLSCEIDGILPSVCTVTGGMMASEVLKLLTGIGESLLGRVAAYDALSGRTREIAYRRADDAPAAVAARAAGAAVAAKEPVQLRPVPHGDAALDSAAPVGTAPSIAVSAPDLAAELAGTPASDLGDSDLGSSDASARPLLLDVREQWESEVASLEHSIRIPLGELGLRLGELDRDADVVVYCHLGVRSRHALTLLSEAGFTHVRHLDGGIDAWSRTVDAEVPRY